MGEPIPIRSATVVVSNGALLITDLIETDDEVIRLVGAAVDPVEATRRCLRIGARSVQAASAALDTETVRDQFDRLVAELNTNVEQAVGQVMSVTTGLLDDETGSLAGALNGHRQQLSSLLDAQFDPDSKQSIMGKVDELVREALDRQSRTIQQAVSLDAAESPMRVMKNEIIASFGAPLAEVSKQVRELSEKIAVNEAIAPVIDITTAKGFAFEEVVHGQVSHIAATHGDYVEMCGSTPGATGSKKGDEVVTLNTDDTGGAERRFVLEAKTRKLSPRAMREELEEALQNRSADAAIAVFDSQTKAPTSTPFSYSDNQAIVVLGDDDVAPLRLAYMWARWVVRRHSAHVDIDTLDAERVNSLISSAQLAIQRHRTIKRGHSQARKGIDQAASQVASLVTEVEAALSDLEAELTSANL